jgi:hypothetical protein
MSNPWTKKNPLMSMWLSAANRSLGSARGQVTRAARRQVGAAQAEAARQVVDFWTGKPVKLAAKPVKRAAKPAARRKTRR